jgi:hypothetical protein
MVDIRFHYPPTGISPRRYAIKLPRATLDREAWRQGEWARKVRRQTDAQASGPVPVEMELVLEPYQMTIQLDAWNIRERDQCVMLNLAPSKTNHGVPAKTQHAVKKQRKLN